ncbi:MAG: redoxin domain-containing protein [Proteobacteria bacterium]|nr:redoxin domain-containing protein [Pseudomonadota bacterium]
MVESSDEFEKLGIRPVGISVDEPSRVQIMTDVHKAKFPLLSDQDLNAHRIFKVLHTLDEETLTRYRKADFDVGIWSDRKHNTMAIPSLFLIDEQLQVLWAHAAHDYKTRPELEQVLKAIASVISKPSS